MKFTKITSFIAAAMLFATPTMAQEKQTEAKPTAAPVATTETSIEELLKEIPENLAKYGDGKFISSALMRGILEVQLKAAAQQGQLPNKEQFAQIFPRLAAAYVEEELLSLEAEKQGIKPDVDKLKKDIEEVKKQPGGEQRLKMFMEAFKAKDEKDFIAKQSRIQMGKMLLDQQIEKIQITDEEAKKFYDENSNAFTELEASHILAAYSDNPRNTPTKEQEEAALKKIQDVHQKLKDGEKFEELAKAHSDCPSKEKGGSLGKFHKGDMIPDFEKALLTMKPGQVSEPVKTQFGYHIIKAGEIKVIPFDEAKTDIIAHLKEVKAKEIVPKYMEELKKSYNLQMLILPKTPIQPVED
ncbi:MAG: peptidylprolyl isomerase [Victivallales bacterium]|nr:peptidylprolyl isomerase [Victivallales bacterium]